MKTIKEIQDMISKFQNDIAEIINRESHSNRVENILGAIIDKLEIQRKKLEEK